jgi:hypothetical protein
MMLDWLLAFIMASVLVAAAVLLVKLGIWVLM